jgi:hypothetical protein
MTQIAYMPMHSGAKRSGFIADSGRKIVDMQRHAIMEAHSPATREGKHIKLMHAIPVDDGVVHVAGWAHRCTTGRPRSHTTHTALKNAAADIVWMHPALHAASTPSQLKGSA